MNLYVTCEGWNTKSKGNSWPVLVTSISGIIADLKKHETLTFWF